MIKLFADFNNADFKGRIRLNTLGTISSLKYHGIELKDGLNVLLDDEDSLRVSGTVQFSKEENIWVAEISWDDIKQYGSSFPSP